MLVSKNQIKESILLSSSLIEHSTSTSTMTLMNMNVPMALKLGTSLLLLAALVATQFNLNVSQDEGTAKAEAVLNSSRKKVSLCERYATNNCISDLSSSLSLSLLSLPLMRSTDRLTCSLLLLILLLLCCLLSCVTVTVEVSFFLFFQVCPKDVSWIEGRQDCTGTSIDTL